jgi:hypothetical protein
VAIRGRTVVRALSVGVVVVVGATGLAFLPNAWASVVRPQVGPPPHRLLPGRSVTTTLNNHTPCRLQLDGGRVGAGHLSQEPPSVIEPGASGTWKVIGWSAFADPDASLALAYTATNCPIAGQQEGYATGNTDANGFYYSDGACAVEPAPRLRNSFTSQNAYHATLTIDLSVQPIGAVQGSTMRPQLGACGLPIS